MRKTVFFGCVAMLLLSSCSLDNVEKDDSLKKYFTAAGLNGYFAMFNNGSGQFTVYNLDRFRDSVYQPAGTFHIVAALVGVETGRVQDASATISLPGGPADSATTNTMTLQEAFNSSSIPWFQELARRIGKDTLQRWLDTLGYASYYEKAVIGDNTDSFWFDNTVKITGDEQLGLVKKLYFGQLPFQARSQRIVAAMMKKEDNSNYQLSYVSAKGLSGNGGATGWLTGWIEENKHPYFFVLQLESPDSSYNMHTESVQILKAILRQYEFLEGRK